METHHGAVSDLVDVATVLEGSKRSGCVVNEKKFPISFAPLFVLKHAFYLQAEHIRHNHAIERIFCSFQHLERGSLQLLVDIDNLCCFEGALAGGRKGKGLCDPGQGSLFLEREAHHQSMESRGTIAREDRFSPSHFGQANKDQELLL